MASGPLDAAGDEETLLDLGRVSGMHRDGVRGWREMGTKEYGIPTCHGSLAFK